MTDVVVGVGMRPGADAAAIVAAARAVVGDAVIRCLATVDRRADAPGLIAAAQRLEVPVVAFTPAELAVVEVPSPSEHSRRALGVSGVAEAAAIRAGAALITRKRVFGDVVVAVATATAAPPRPHSVR